MKTKPLSELQNKDLYTCENPEHGVYHLNSDPSKRFKAEGFKEPEKKKEEKK